MAPIEMPKAYCLLKLKLSKKKLNSRRGLAFEVWYKCKFVSLNEIFNHA
jgi:hypothetical protein